MKKILLVLWVVVPALAAETKPLVTKWSGGGYMMPEGAGYEQCELFANKVVLTRQFGMSKPTAVQLVEERPITVTGDVVLLIEKARSEKLTEKPNLLCDAPSTSITADSGQGEAVLLFVTGGCGSPRRERTGIFSSKLRSIIDLYCPKTHVVGTR